MTNRERHPYLAERWRVAAALVLVTSLLGLSGYIFWLQDWKYGLPTPRPQDLHEVAIGSRPTLPPSIAAWQAQAAGRPLFLHFFNPDCPCSRFNEDHVLDLIRKSRGTTLFVAIVEPEGGALAPDTVQQVERDFGIPAAFDASGDIGRAVGVYSTPQAVIISPDGSLYFRGNYNLSRYCADPHSEYARLALEHVLAGKPFDAPQGATVAYGCPLPSSIEQKETRATP